MKARILALGVVCAAVVAMAGEADHSWLQRVPPADRVRANPYTGQGDAIDAGAKLYAQHCSRCHGMEMLGNGSKPGLRTLTIQHASDGELFWILKNGDLRHGMPSWSSLPEAYRWQMVAFLRSQQEPVQTDENQSGEKQ